jgi:hypothetical protein
MDATKIGREAPLRDWMLGVILHLGPHSREPARTEIPAWHRCFPPEFVVRRDINQRFHSDSQAPLRVRPGSSELYCKLEGADTLNKPSRVGARSAPRTSGHPRPAQVPARRRPVQTAHVSPTLAVSSIQATTPINTADDEIISTTIAITYLSMSSADILVRPLITTPPHLC